MKRAAPILLIGAQVILFGIELFTNYDPLPRRIALAVTNVATVGIFLRVRWWLGTKTIAFPWFVLAFASAAVWLDALGNFQHLYARYWWWDRVAHAFGSVPIMLGFVVVLELLASHRRIKLPFWARGIFAMALANTLGGLYEISEWLGDIWFRTERVRGPFDTPHDLLNNLLGTLLVLLGLAVYHRLTGWRDPATLWPRTAQDLRPGHENGP